MQQFSGLFFAVFRFSYSTTTLLFFFLYLANFANAGQVLLSAVKDLNPLADAVLKVNNERVYLSETGTAAFELNAGTYEANLEQYGVQLVSFKIELTDAENFADINVLLEEGVEPKVDVKRYTATSEKLKSLGVISGFVTNKESGEAISGVVISDETGQYSTTSKKDGSYELKLLRGQYDLRFASPEFALVKVKEFTVPADSFLEFNISMAKEGAEEIEEVLAVGSYVADSVTADERDSSAILDVIGAEQLSRFGDSSAASALTRVAGVSINDGKYAVVRGLNERYTAVTLNGSTLPSPDPTRRVVPLDIFPSFILSQINVSKTNSADLISDSTGGVIELNTQQMVSEAQKKLSISLAHTSHVTMSNVNSYDGGDRDFLGMDDGSRSLPTEVSNSIAGFEDSTISDAEIQEAGRAFDNNYQLNKHKPLPDVSIEYSQQNIFPIEGSENQWSYIGGVKYRNQWERENSQRATYSFGSGELIKDDTYQYDRASNSIDLSAVYSARFDVNTQHSYTSNTLLLRQSQADATYRFGTIGDNDRDVKASYLGWEEKQFFIQQFLGEHRFFNEADLKANWRLGVSKAELDSPDNREYSYETPDTNPHTLFDSSIGREFIALDDDNTDLGVSLEGIVINTDHWQLSAKAGFDYFDRERNSVLERFGFDDVSNATITDLNLENVLSSANINPAQFKLLYQTLASDSYQGTWEYDALYSKLNFEYFDVFNLEFGARSENSLQVLDTADFNGIPKTTELDDSGVLPSINITWFTTENFQTRLGFSQTKNRPDFREISESIFYHPETRDKYKGNDNLGIAEIDNMDVRVEWYLSDRESISLAFFNKDFVNPIEVTANPGGGDSVIYSFENQKEANVNGIEFDFKKEKEFSRGLGFISGNISVIDSEVTLFTADITGKTKRAMQGQPDNIVNLQVGFNDYKNAWEYTLVANRKGESLYAVGIQSLPDIIEEARIQIDVNAKNQVRENLSVKLAIDNLNDATVEYSQGDEYVRKFKKGRTASASLSYTF